MRLNQFLASASHLSRRAADQAIADGRVSVNGRLATIGQRLEAADEVRLDDATLRLPQQQTTIMLHKPTGYITSRSQQGKTQTIYDLLPANLHHLKPVGRLDKDSSGLLLLSSDGQLINRLSHPSHGKWKLYSLQLDRQLSNDDAIRLERGVKLDDGLSRLKIISRQPLTVGLQEGRNRQIRRTLASIGYTVKTLHRISLGKIQLGDLPVGQFRVIEETSL
jgi:pseudouridine synthase